MKLLVYTTFIIVLSSCAGIINKRTQKLYISSKDSIVVLKNSDTISAKALEHIVRVKRSPLPSTLSIASDSAFQEINLSPKNSTAYLLNFASPTFLINLLIDGRKVKRFEYDQDYYVDFNNVFERAELLGYRKRALSKPNIIKFTPLKFIGIGNQATEFAYERRLSKHFSAQLMVSALHQSSMLNTFNAGVQSGGRTALELRYFLEIKNPGGYIALEYDYYSVLKKLNQTFYQPTQGITIENTYRLYKNANTLSVKIGRQKYINNFVIDAYVGIGFRVRDIRVENKNKPRGYLELEEQIFLPDDRNRIGKSVGISIPLNIRIGYAF